MSDEARRSELGSFLRAKRRALNPAALGNAPGRRRRTPGLRREEVAVAAGVGVTWYTRLEQGRAIGVSKETVRRVVRALQLTPTDEEYLLRLASAEAEEPQVARKEELPGPDALVQGIVDSVERIPAFAIDARTDVVAYNALADRIYTFEGPHSPFACNHAWRYFADPARRAILQQDAWEQLIASGIGILRSNYASHIGDPRFEALVRDLGERSADFRRLWDGGYTAPVSSVLPLVFDHPQMGRFTVESTRLTLPARPGLILLLLMPGDDATRKIFARSPKSPTAG